MSWLIKCLAFILFSICLNITCVYANTTQQPNTPSQEKLLQEITKLEKQALAGNIKAQIFLSKLFFDANQHEKGVYYMEMAAKQGNVVAQGYVALIYMEGQGVVQDYAKALYYFEQAANQGSDKSAFSLGYMHYQGWGTPQNDVKAFEWFKKAEALKSSESYYTIGLMYFIGQGTAQNKIKGYAYVYAVKDIITWQDVSGVLQSFETKMTPQEIAAGKNMSIALRQALN